MARFVIDSMIPPKDEHDSSSVYERAMNLIKKLEAKGVMASIVPGGIGIYPKDEAEEQVMRDVCQEAGAPKPETGDTMHESNVKFR